MVKIEWDLSNSSIPLCPFLSPTRTLLQSACSTLHIRLSRSIHNQFQIPPFYSNTCRRRLCRRPRPCRCWSRREAMVARPSGGLIMCLSTYRRCNRIALERATYPHSIPFFGAAQERQLVVAASSSTLSPSPSRAGGL